MSLRALILCFFMFMAPAITASQQPPPDDSKDEAARDVRLPSGKMQKDEILKADHEKNLDDAAKLAKMAEDLRAAIEKSDHNVLSLDLLKQTEEIEKLARRIRSRMRKF